MTRRWRFILPVLLVATGPAFAADPPMSQDQAMTLLRDGKRQEALQAFESIIASRPPDPSPALYTAGLIDMEDGNWRAAKPLVERLVKLRPGFFPGWELMVQVDQTAGEIEARDAAIKSLYAARRSALEPAVRSQVAYARDRIFGPKRTLLAQEALDPGGDDVARFVFQPMDELGHPSHMIVVSSDNETNERWRQDGTVPYGTVVYHLDTVERLPNNRAVSRPYEFYLEPPSYERVRAKVVEILAGTAQPLSGPADPWWTGEPAR